jgi:2-oxoisovalerate dehydrogenase E1 component
MPKCQIVKPEQVRMSGQIDFSPIPINQYNKIIQDELES